MVPLVYLAGVFFNPHGFSGIWQKIAMVNPFLYIVDGFRYGFIEHSSYNVILGALFVLSCSIIVNLIGFLLLKRGINIKH
jgi:ABC-2 type transport system permease protein